MKLTRFSKLLIAAFAVIVAVKVVFPVLSEGFNARPFNKEEVMKFLEGKKGEEVVEFCTDTTGLKTGREVYVCKLQENYVPGVYSDVVVVHRKLDDPNMFYILPVEQMEEEEEKAYYYAALQKSN